MEKIEFLAYMLDKLNAMKDFDSGIPDIFCELCDYLDFGYGFIYRIHHDKQYRLRHEYSRYAAAPPEKTICLQDYLTKEQTKQLCTSRMVAYRESNGNSELGKSLSDLLHARSLLLIPITEDRRQLMGFIGIADRRGIARADDEDMTFGYAILSTLSNYIENKRNEEIINRMARYDSLTGLPNRYCLTEDCDGMLPLLADGRQEGYVIFIDLDGFKLVNDTMGHHSGDSMLVKIGEMLSADEQIRDHCYRYGGDEFVILCYGERSAHIRDILAYLRQCFSNTLTLPEGAAVCRASIGVSHFPHDDNKTAGLMRKADHAMYASKERGDGLPVFYNRGEPCLLPEYRLIP